MITFTIPGAPQGKGRPRIGKIGQHARMFTPDKTVAYEGLVAYAAQDAMAGGDPIDKPCRCVMHILCPVPASWSQKKREQAWAGIIRPGVKPDTDNVVKAVFDGMNGVVWRDDVLCVDLHAIKRYAATPGVSVLVEEMK